MDYAPLRVLPEVPPGGAVAGIDWASQGHAVCVEGVNGEVRDRFTVAHDRAGITSLIARLRRAGVGEAAIERGDGPLADALLAAGLTVAVIAPRRVANLRARHAASGAKDDHFDAFVLADALRTDRARLRPLVPASPAALALRALCRFRKDLVRDRVRAGNRLRAHLETAFPGAVGLFSTLECRLSLAFLAAFPTSAHAAHLDEEAVAAWLATVPSRGGCAPAGVLAARLAAAAPGTGDPELLAPLTAAMAGAAGEAAARARAAEAEIAVQLAAHPDGHVFLSLPRAGTVRAARLLAEIGDCRSRYPSAAALAGAAGVAPVTRRSGKWVSHAFRWHASGDLRDALCDFADGSRRANAWAADTYDRARSRGKDHPHAVRILARAWTDVIWACWQAGVPYDPGKHRALQDILARQAAGPEQGEDR
jgi:transposase